ncbi:MAG: hypothetical protein MNPFHGCM_02205 [Gemmatimonadaceae bacterium]|nr:hypothetical protein [Gemmatimonadaceae bacterium]
MLATPCCALLPKCRLLVALTAATGIVMPLPGAGAQDPAGQARRGTARAVRTAPVIDGRLDESVWMEGATFDGFIQRDPAEGQPVTERTEVRVLTDGEALYVGAWLFDREPRLIVAGEKVRDVTLSNSDYFSFILDTYLDRQNGFVFGTTPAGVEYDGQVVKEGEGGGVFQSGQTRMQAGSMGGFNLNWDGSWTVATSQDSSGWYAEFRIPFSTLRYGGGATQVWGFNMSRNIRRKNEESHWSPIPREFNLYRLSRAGLLEGLEVPARRVATITPYVLGSSSRDFQATGSYNTTGDFGFDAKYGLTPSLTLDLTYNTDFAQVEVDEQRTNLTRFPLFFPEKRPFFLENAGTFSAGTPQAVDLFFSRRIGIDGSGNPVPIVGGGRLTGRVGGTTVGLLQIITEDTPTSPQGNSYSVARFSRELGPRSRVGILAVQRMSTDSSANRNRTYSLDGRVGLGDKWTVDWWGAKTETPEATGDELAYSGNVQYQTSDWSNNIRFMQVGEDFNPEVGFLNRMDGYRYYEVAFMRTVRNASWRRVRVWNPHVNYRWYFNLDGTAASGQVHVDMTEVEFNSGARFGPELNFFREGLRQPFTIATKYRDGITVPDSITLPVGDYDYLTASLDWSTNPSAPLSFSLRGDFGPFYNGTRNGGNANVTYRRSALTTSLLVDYNDVHLDQGDFVRKLVGARVGYFFTPKVFIQSLVQYNNQARVWTANARFGWLSTAGTGLFVVFNDGREADGFFDWVRPQSRSLVVKYTRQIGTGQ